MRTLHAGLILSLILILTSCTPDPSHYVEKKKFDELQVQLNSVQAKLDDAQKQLADYQAHRYSLFNVGVRTFRMDSITGETCIKLASNSDWKRAETIRQSCDCQDFLTNYKAAQNAELRKMFCGY